MTNEEKAKELAEKWRVYDKIFLEMAEWKDQQFKEYLQNKIDKLCEFGCKTNSSEITKSCADKMVVLGEIINELFKED